MSRKPTIPLPKIMYRVDDVAQAISLSRAHVYRLVAEGTLQSVRIGKAIRIPAVGLDLFIESLS